MIRRATYYALVSILPAFYQLALAQYAGLIITEVCTQPSADEFIELWNGNASGLINLEGVVISDEDDSTTEGACRFPTGTQLAAQETLVIAVNTTATPPSWLHALPRPTRVYYEPSRNVGAWSPPPGVTLHPLDDYPRSAGGTSSTITLAAADGAAVYRPGVVFQPGPGQGPTPKTHCIDGMNYNNTSDEPANPINPNGQLDPRANRAGNRQPPSGQSLHRLTASINTNSSLLFAEGSISPGTTPLSTSIPPCSDLDGDDICDNDEGPNLSLPAAQTNAWLLDSDGDGLNDGAEDADRNGLRDNGETNPRHADSDSDRFEDGIETLTGTDPLLVDAGFADADNDALPDSLDTFPGRDADGDRYDDGSDAAAARDRTAAADPQRRPHWGDADGDGLLTNLDALLTHSLFVGNVEPTSPLFDRGPRHTDGFRFLDPSRDGVISQVDALIIHAFFLGNVAALPPRP